MAPQRRVHHPGFRTERRPRAGGDPQEVARHVPVLAVRIGDERRDVLHGLAVDRQGVDQRAELARQRQRVGRVAETSNCSSSSSRINARSTLRAHASTSWRQRQPARRGGRLGGSDPAAAPSSPSASPCLSRICASSASSMSPRERSAAAASPVRRGGRPARPRRPAPRGGWAEDRSRPKVTADRPGPAIPAPACRSPARRPA